MSWFAFASDHEHLSHSIVAEADFDPEVYAEEVIAHSDTSEGDFEVDSEFEKDSEYENIAEFGDHFDMWAWALRNNRELNVIPDNIGSGDDSSHLED